MNQLAIFSSPEDEIEENQLLVHLNFLKDVNIWSRALILPGDNWKTEFARQVTKADVAILFITANFLNFDFMQRRIIPQLLERHRQGELIIFPLIAKHCAWEMIDWLDDMEVCPRNRKPVWDDAGNNIERDLAAIAKEVTLIINSRKNNSVESINEFKFADKVWMKLPLGRIAAGEPIEIPESISINENGTFSNSEYITVPISQGLARKAQYLCVLEVVGHSMIDADIHNGDLVVMSKQAADQFIMRDYVYIVWLKDEEQVTLKHIYDEGNGCIRLQPRNKKYKPTLTTLENVEILGYVVDVIDYISI